MPRAMATILRWPPLRFIPWRRISSRTSGNTDSTRSSTSPSASASSLRRAFADIQRLIIMFSATVSSGKISHPSGA